MNTIESKELMNALRTLAALTLPMYDMVITPKAEKLRKEPVKKVEKNPNRYNVKTRKGATGVVRQKKFDWSGANIDRDVKRIAEKGGRHVFFTSMLSEEKAKSFHSAICNVADKLIGKEPDNTKRWRTTRDKLANTITLFVKKAV
jgi:hypothetical protein